jgi:hypothetical protein
MPSPLNTKRIIQCNCGCVQMEARGSPILTVVCYCDDCQEGARQIEALPDAQTLREADGGTACVLYRKDRVSFIKGETLLGTSKIKQNSATSRLVATCCNSAMLMKFDDGRHWTPVYRVRIKDDPPPLQMRICTKFKAANVTIPSDVPGYPGYPVKMMGKLVIAWIPMLFGR